MKPLRILIVEDDAMIAFLLGEVLIGMGYEVCATAGTEDQAIAAAVRCEPDLMIVDEHLGVGSGLRVVDVVLGRRYVPHVFVSGDAMKIKRLRPDAIVLEKPYFETDLAPAIESALGRGLGAPLRQVGLPVGSALVRPLQIPLVDGCA